MSDIPSEINLQILLLLPADSLFRFRGVCKEWRRLIDDPSFVKAHTQNQIFSSTVLIRSSRSRFHLVDFDSLEFSNDQPSGHLRASRDSHSNSQMVEAIPVKQLVRRDVPRLQRLPVNSCNGLVLISTYDINKIWAVWNPLTRDCHRLPLPDCSSFSFSASGLGYDHVSDDYKVVRMDTISHGQKYVCRTLVYSLKLDYWKRIKDCPYDCFRILGRCSGVCVNGKLHWYACEMIITLDLVTEEYSHIPLPPKPSSEEITYMYLHAINGLVILSYSYITSIGCQFEGWVLQEYRVETPWNKLLSFQLNCFQSLKLVAFLKNKKQAILEHEDGFVVVDIESNSVKQVRVDGLIGISSQVCPGSLYRLDDRAITRKPVSSSTGVKRKRKQTRNRTITRLKVYVSDESYSCEVDEY